MNKGLVHVYTGNGKGKTTAAIGQAVRAKGAGLSVCVLQFLKTEDSGELKCLEKLGISVIRKETVSGFFNGLSSEQRQQLKSEVEYEFALLKRIMPQYDMVILDEIFGAVENGLLSLGSLMRLIRKKPESTELILTGRHAPLGIIEIADYASEIRVIKHPFDEGVPARPGIEF